MRGNRRAILVDIHEKKLDPKKSYTAVDKSGHLSDVKTLESRQQPVFASSGIVSSDVKQQKKQQELKVESKLEAVTVAAEETLEVLSTEKESIQSSHNDEMIETTTLQELQESKIEKNHKKKKKSLNQD